jgi:hypothetical protein
MVNATAENVLRGDIRVPESHNLAPRARETSSYMPSFHPIYRHFMNQRMLKPWLTSHSTLLLLHELEEHTRRVYLWIINS